MKQTQEGSRFFNFIKESEIGTDLIPLEGTPKINDLEVIVLQVASIYVDTADYPEINTYMCAEVIDPSKLKGW